MSSTTVSKKRKTGAALGNKKKHKAQWNRESAHKVLQLRTALLSNQWDQDWQLVKEEIYKKVAWKLY